MQKEWVSLWVVAWLALHHLHHPDELDGVVKKNMGSRTNESQQRVSDAG